MKVAVIGCTHAGTAAINNMLKLHPEAEITVFERNDTISFLSCGIALHVSGVVEDPTSLFYSSPEALNQKGVKTLMRHEVSRVDFETKTIEVVNLETNEAFSEAYDKLVITTGSWPILPPIDGIGLENIQLCKNYDHSRAIVEKAKSADRVVVIGAGYIGVELAEAFKENGKNVVLIDAADRILSKYLDTELTERFESSLKQHGVDLALGQMVQGFEGTPDGLVKTVVTNRGRYEADLVILCIGFKPATALFKGQLEMDQHGAILVDPYMRTSVTDVFAAGDCCTVMYNPTGSPLYIPLATNAVRMGTIVAHNLKGPKIRHRGTQGTSGIKIFDNHAAATGLTEDQAQAIGIDAGSVLVKDAYRPEFMPSYEEALLKVVYDKGTQRVLGAQILSQVDLTQMMNTLSVAIQNHMTMEDLAFTDFFFLPHYNKPWSLINLAGLKTLD